MAKIMNTAYIKVIVNDCIGCWKCVDACPKQVLGKVKFLWHHHAKISNPDACIGCMKCVKVCPQHIIANL